MTPPATTGTHRDAPAADRHAARHPGATGGHGATAPRAPRRVSGPARRRDGHPAPATAAAAAAPPLAVGLARAAGRIGDARLLDRLVRGRAWIALIAVGLIGIVFMQVSMLGMNAGISRAVAGAEALERQNASLRADISRLDSDERIQQGAAALGLAMPPAGAVIYLDARRADPRAAARGVKPPDPAAAETAAEQAAATGTSLATTATAVTPAGTTEITVGAPSASATAPTAVPTAPTATPVSPAAPAAVTAAPAAVPSTTTTTPTTAHAAPVTTTDPATTDPAATTTSTTATTSTTPSSSTPPVPVATAAGGQ
jgi:hypothetical protein